MKIFKPYTNLIETALARQDWDREPEELYQPISYVLSLGGKRLRPALCLAGCDLYGGKIEEAVMPALGIEIFHNFSLVHDDIMDQASLRRGKKTVHRKWDLNRGILSGDAMLVKAYQYIAEVDRSVLPMILQSFSRTALEVCEGQQMDMNFETEKQVSEEEYLEMIELKTAVLVACALKVGAHIGGAKPEQAQALWDFGLYMGMAFQVQDDLLDAFGDPQKVGKTPGGDILQDKKTLLMIYAAQADEQKLSELQGRSWQEREKVAAFQKFFQESEARKKTEEKRDMLLEQALAALKDARSENQALEEKLADFARWLAHRDK